MKKIKITLLGFIALLASCAPGEIVQPEENNTQETETPEGIPGELPTMVKAEDCGTGCVIDLDKISYEKITYDGNKIKTLGEERFTYTGNLITKITNNYGVFDFIYDSNNKLVKRIFTGSDGRKQETTYTHKSNGTIVEYKDDTEIKHNDLYNVDYRDGTERINEYVFDENKNVVIKWYRVFSHHFADHPKREPSRSLHYSVAYFNEYDDKPNPYKNVLGYDAISFTKESKGVYGCGAGVGANNLIKTTEKAQASTPNSDIFYYYVHLDTDNYLKEINLSFKDIEKWRTTGTINFEYEYNQKGQPISRKYDGSTENRAIRHKGASLFKY